jgi:hypothetical protein
MASKPRSRADLALAVLAILGAILAIAIWIPSDSASGLIETVRRQTRVGDALGPTVAASFILFGGLMLLLRPVVSEARLTGQNLTFLLLILAGFALCIALMRWVGPLAVQLFAGPEATYRDLRDSAPWKYLGFLAGGWSMVFAMICRGEGRLSWRAALIAVLACLALIAVYDLPFDDLLLPPNGDV